MNRLMIYDQTTLSDTDPDNDALALSWKWGDKLYRTVRSVDKAKGVSSWYEAFDWLTSEGSREKISMIQFWGHGSSGAAYIGGSALNMNKIEQNAEFKGKLEKLRDVLADDAVIWFRNCYMFGGRQGQMFARDFSNLMSCKIAAHTYKIGFFQSGLHTVSPGEELGAWDLYEGMSNRDADKPEFKWSGPFVKNTITCLHAQIPKGW